MSSRQEDIERAHLATTNNRRRILESTLCGCISCCAVFHPTDVERWAYPTGDGEGQTALCPRCGLADVIGSADRFPITQAFLVAVQASLPD